MSADAFSIDGHQTARRAEYLLNLIFYFSAIFVQMAMGSLIPL
jgi:hypothetical protein